MTVRHVTAPPAGAATATVNRLPVLLLPSDYFANRLVDPVLQQIEHPVAGPISLEYTGLAVEGRPDLTLIVYHPATAADEARVRQLLAT